MQSNKPTGTVDSCSFAKAVNAETRERLRALVSRQSALSEPEIALFRQVYPILFKAHYRKVVGALWALGVEEAARPDLAQQVFTAFYLEVVREGFPPSIVGRLVAITAGIASNHRRALRRSPLSLGLPSSRGEPAQSAPEIERVMDHVELGRRLLPALSPEHREVIVAVLIRELTHAEAAEELGIPRTTLTSRLIAAKERLAALAPLFVPESQRVGR